MGVKPGPDDEAERLREQTAAMNQELMLSAVRQNELLEVTEKLNAELQSEIAERKRTEEALREAEKRYHSLFDNMLDGYAYCRMIFDDKGRPDDFIYLDTNSSFESLTGLKDVVGKRVTEVIPRIKELSPELFEIYGRVALTGVPETVELYFKPFGIWLSIKVYSTEKGNFVAVFDNITKRSMAESVTQARLRLSVTTGPMSLDDILQKTLDEIEALTQSTIGFYHFLEADQETLSLQHWSTNTLKETCTAEGKNSHYPVSKAGAWVDCLHERRPVVHNDYASLPHRKGMPPGHAPVIREMVIPIIRGDRVVAIIGVGNKQGDYNESDIEIASLMGDFSWEIVERKRAEEALNISELRYRRLFESSKDGLLLLEADDGTVFDVNPSFTEMTGYPREELVGKKIWETGPLKNIESAKNAFKELSNKRQAHYENLPLETSDGRVIEVEILSRVYTVKPKKIIQCNIRDISERMALEKRKADFYAMITHDIKSPLTVISGYSEILKSKAGKYDDDTNGMVYAINSSTGKIETLIDNFLSISKVESGKFAIHPAPTDIAALLRDACMEIEYAAQRKKLGLNMEIADGMPEAMVDSRLIQRAVMNLLQNAVHYTPAHGKITVKGAFDGSDIIISITDTGKGVPAEEQQAIFEKYYRSKKTVGIKGTGLGLTIVKAVAEAHGGRATVESEPGKGSTFHIYLPLKDNC